MTGGSIIFDAALSPQHAGWRLDRALADALPTLSRERLKALVRAGALTGDGQAVRDPALKVRGSEAFRLAVPEPEPAHNEPQDIPLSILFEDEHLLVVDKPAGLVVHPAAGNRDGTLVNALLHHCAGRLSGIGGVARPGIVHRIDKDTSGALVITKTDEAHRKLVEVFSKHEIDRVYWALCYGEPAARSGRIETRIGRNPSDRKKMGVLSGKEGRQAITHYRVLEAYGVPSKKPFASWIEARLETGRTHQVRVHLTHIGHSLLGDPVYGTPSARQDKWLSLPAPVRAAVEALPGQALHARVLGFEHPITGEKLHFEAEVPEAFRALMLEMEKFRREI